jgi:hypothetical protein
MDRIKFLLVFFMMLTGALSHANQIADMERMEQQQEKQYPSQCAKFIPL